jgi:hypothetical protein
MINVQTIPTISTIHVPSETAIAEAQLLAAPYEYGWFLWAGADTSLEEFPEWYVALVMWAKERKFEWVRLDCDADTVDDLEQWEW